MKEKGATPLIYYKYKQEEFSEYVKQFALDNGIMSNNILVAIWIPDLPQGVELTDEEVETLYLRKATEEPRKVRFYQYRNK